MSVDEAPAGFEATIVCTEAPDWRGVPNNTPVSESRIKPSGKLGETSHTSGPSPMNEGVYGSISMPT